MDELVSIHFNAIQFYWGNHKLLRRPSPPERRCIMNDVINGNDLKNKIDVDCGKLSVFNMLPSLPKISSARSSLLEQWLFNIVILYAFVILSRTETVIANPAYFSKNESSPVFNFTLDRDMEAAKPFETLKISSPSSITVNHTLSPSLLKANTTSFGGTSTLSYEESSTSQTISFSEIPSTSRLVTTTETSPPLPSSRSYFSYDRNTAIGPKASDESINETDVNPKFSYLEAATAAKLPLPNVITAASSGDSKNISLSDNHVYTIIKSRNDTLQTLNDLKQKLPRRGAVVATPSLLNNVSSQSTESIKYLASLPSLKTIRSSIPSDSNMVTHAYNQLSKSTLPSTTSSSTHYSTTVQISRLVTSSESNDLPRISKEDSNSDFKDEGVSSNRAVKRLNAPQSQPGTLNDTDSMIRDAEMGAQPERVPIPEFDPDRKNPKIKGVNNGGGAFAEPAPVWKFAKEQWGIFWNVHVYGFGVLFLLLSVISFLSMIRISTFTKLLSRQYFITLDFLMFVVCVFRAFYLLYDPYNSSNSFSPILAYFVFNTGFPFFTAAFSVLFLSLLRATRLQMLSPRIQRPSVLATIIGIHFTFSIATDIIVGILTDVKILVTVCQIMFISWAILLAISYFYVFRKLHRSALFSQSAMMRTAFTNIHVSGGKWPKGILKPSLSLAVKLTLVSAVFALLLAGTMIYGMVDVHGLFVLNAPKPWPWWAYQTTFRGLEACMCAIMIYVGSRPLRQYESKTDLFNLFRCCREKREYQNVTDLYPSHFSAHLQPIIKDPRDVPILDENHSVSLPGYGRTNYVGGSLGESPKATSMKLMNAPLSNASVISAISNQKCNSFKPTARADIRSTTTLSTASGSRPSSMLIKDNGFIRFRRDSDTDENMSDIDETRDGRDGGTTSQDEAESLRPQIGSIPDENAFNDDVSFNTSPFFRNGYKPYYNHRISCVSGFSGDTTTDIDGSDEHLSDLPVKLMSSNTRLRKCGSTCSSESAGNSFDISMFLSRSVGVQTNSARPVSACYTDSRYRPISDAVSDDDISTVDGHEKMIYSRPETTSRPEGLDLTSKRTALPSHVINSPMQDITPDSAVYLDLHIPKLKSPLTIPENLVSESSSMVPFNQKQHHYQKRVSGSQSMNDLTKRTCSNSPLTSYHRIKKSTESLLSRLKGSTFSLNASLDGYKLLKSNDDEATLELSAIKPGKLRRTLSERRHRANKPNLKKSAKYMSVCNSRELEARFLEDVNDGDDSGAGGSKEDIEMADEECQTDPVVIIQDKISEMCSVIKHLGDDRQPILDVAAT